jgi:hypothetical protein
MLDFFGRHMSEIVSFVIGLIGGGTAGSILTVKFSGKNISSTDHGTSVDQRSASAGGDIVGRDKRS